MIIYMCSIIIITIVLHYYIEMRLTKCSGQPHFYIIILINQVY